MDHDEAARFARDWVDGWNSHDLDRIMAHYADEVEFRSPAAARLLPHTHGVLRGKAALREYWAEGLRRIDGLHFEVIGVYAAMDGLVINYRNQAGDLVNEVLLLRDGLVVSGFGAYAPPAAGGNWGPAEELSRLARCNRRGPAKYEFAGPHLSASRRAPASRTTFPAAGVRRDTGCLRAAPAARGCDRAVRSRIGEDACSQLYSPESPHHKSFRDIHRHSRPDSPCASTSVCPGAG